ncbi:MAG: hypothetical protein ACTHLW_20510, partial [Verrucomicrobiota bacterium]
MKQNLRIAAFVLMLAALAFWAASGANRGWTKNQVQIKTTDEVTGLESVQWQDKFVPGVDFLALSFAACGLLAGASFLIQ